MALAHEHGGDARARASFCGGEDPRFVRAAQSLVERLREREEQLAKLGKIIDQINLGLTLDEVLNFRNILAV